MRLVYSNKEHEGHEGHGVVIFVVLHVLCAPLK